MAFSAGLFLKFKDDLDYRQLIVCDLIKYTSLSPLLGWDGTLMMISHQRMIIECMC